MKDDIGSRAGIRAQGSLNTETLEKAGSRPKVFMKSNNRCDGVKKSTQRKFVHWYYELILTGEFQLKA